MKRSCGIYKAVLSADTPEGLLNAVTVFFSNGMNFILRNGEEHRDLKRNSSPDGRVRYTYTENTSKNRSGGFNQLDVPHKVVHQYEDPRAGPRCHVFLLDLYLSQIELRTRTSSTCDHFPVYHLVNLYPGLPVHLLARTPSFK